MADQQELLWQRGRPLTSRQSRRRSRHKSIPRSGHSPCLFSRNQARDGTRTIRQTGRSLPLYLTGFHAPHWDSEMTSRIFYWSSCNRNDVLTWAAAVKSEARTRKASADHNSTTDYERTDNARNTQILPDVRDNLLQYTVLPFGLRNAPATFQRFQQELLRLPPTMQEESRPSQRHPLSWLDDDAEMVAACKSVEDSLISKQPTIGAAATRTSPKAPALQRLLVLLLLLIPLLLNPLLVR
nr:uncharacterized protein LOC129156314 isoform X1 [Nothobranchius furzeri]XP_054594829.1 uncharacterized protein LOC129162659 isoform X1 [Nothobranchius furzeri]XP_054600012.1 uncharacterized protein LOC129164337 isoform X1 [Nothobranchius furzeri]